MMKISIVVPCFNEQEALPMFIQEIEKVFREINCEHEIIFINDGSTDNTLSILKESSKLNSRIKYLSFSRNFGKESAIFAGFCNSSGDYIAVMDADMQDPPALLPKMIELIQNEGYDSVATRRVTRKGEPPIRSWFAKLFYRIINKISDSDIVDGARDFRLMRRDMVDAIIAMGESNRFSKGIFGWVGFRTYWLPYENVERIAGSTKWNFWKLFKYAVSGVINFSEIPLNLASWMGLFVTLIVFCFLLFIIIRKIVFGDPVDGWASTICVIGFLGGIQLFCLGIIGQYVAKTYSETKKRPHYIIKESNISIIEKIK